MGSEQSSQAQPAKTTNDSVLHFNCPICKLLGCARAASVRRFLPAELIGTREDPSLYPPAPHPVLGPAWRRAGEGDEAFHERWYWEYLRSRVRRQPDRLPCVEKFEIYMSFHKADFQNWYEEIKKLPSLRISPLTWASQRAADIPTERDLTSHSGPTSPAGPAGTVSLASLSLTSPISATRDDGAGVFPKH